MSLRSAHFERGCGLWGLTSRLKHHAHGSGELQIGLVLVGRPRCRLSLASLRISRVRRRPSQGSMSDSRGMIGHGQLMKSKVVGIIGIHNVVLNLLPSRVLHGLLLLTSRMGSLLRLGSTGEALVTTIHFGRRWGYSCTGVVLMASGVICCNCWACST